MKRLKTRFKTNVCRLLLASSMLLILAVNSSAQNIFLGTDVSTGPQCNCLDNSTTLSDGQFQDTITILGAIGETWTITNATIGAYIEASLDPPLAPTLVVGGEVFNEVSPGIYQFIVKHVDAVGFTLFADNGVETRRISNTCFYPNISIIGLPDSICLTSNPVTLTADNGSVTGSGAFTINGQPAISFNAQLLGEGIHTVSYTFDAGTGTADDSNDPACTTTVIQDVEVPEQPNTAVIAFVNVTLGDDCEAEITPRMMMTGNYPCLDDFMVSVFDQFGINIGNTVNGLHAGQQLNVRVMSEVGQFIGNGLINITDDSPPTITCLPLTTSADISNEVQFLTGSISNSDNSFIPNNFSCYNPAVEFMSGSHYYTLREINVTATDYYTIELSHDALNGGVFGLYQGEFDPFQGPCQGNAGVSEAQPIGDGYYSTLNNVTRLHVMLTPDMPYTLLTTTFDGNEIGDYEYAFYSQGSGEIVGLNNSVTADISLPLFCSVVPSLVDNPSSLDLLGEPIIVDACMLDPDVTFTDAYVSTGHCNVETITRTFTVTDQSGNSDQCTQIIEFPIITLDDVNLPPKTINISCDETYPTDDDGNPSPTVTGYPFVVAADGTHNIDPVYCNMLSNYSDFPEVQVCTGTISFIRRWVVFDNCNPGDIIEYDQLVVIGDRTAPTMQCSAPDADMNGLPDTLVYSSGAGNCLATILAPLPTVTDNCSGWQVLTELVTEQLVPITNPFGTIIGYDTVTVVLATVPNAGNRLITGIPMGVHYFRYTAMDDCWNTSVIECPIKVIDSGSPTAACDDLIHVSLGGDGTGVITAEDIDEGSSDGCGPVTLQIRREIDFNPDDCTASPLVTTDWGPTIDLYCCEAGSTIEVELLVTDVGGIVNTCTGMVSIDDTTAPICVAPAPVFTNCSEIPNGTDFDDIDMLQSLYGMPTVIDACHGTVINELQPMVEMSSCGLGTILRRFETTDIAGNSSTCQQLINLTVHTDYEIKFPKDVEGECEQPGADTLVVNGNGCDEFSVIVDDEFFGSALDACYKILRTYTVTNWCEYDGFSEGIEIGRNVACLAERGTEDIWVIRRSDGSTYLDVDNDEENGIPAAGTRSTACDGNTNPDGYLTPATSNGRWIYTQMIKVTDTSMPVITVSAPDPFCSSNTTCTGRAVIDFSVSDGGCSANPPTVSIAIDLNNTGAFTAPATLAEAFPDYEVSGTFPIGNHRLRIRVTDVCENTSEEIIDFSVVDCIAAGLVCNPAIAQTLMAQPPGVDADGDGDFDVAAAAVNVNLFVNSTGQDCSGIASFTIHRISALETGADVAFPNHPALVVTCDDIGFIPVRIYLWDNAFNPYAVQPDGTIGGPNYTTCDALLHVQDPNNECVQTAGMGMVSGLIMTEGGVPVSGVEISPRDDMMDEMMMTENDGLYSFDLETQHDYHITPYSENDYLNGVTTFDIVLISKHILNVTPLDSPYKILAADVNGSNTVSTLDLVHLRKTILGITDGFTNSASWRFVHAGFEFPDPSNPWLEPFPESMAIAGLADNIPSADFIAVKIGDLNGSVAANALETGDDRSNEDIYYLRTEDVTFEGGETVEAIFTSADEMDEVQGFQLTLQFEPSVLSLEDIEWGHIQAQNVNTSMADRGIITISWNDNSQSADFSQGELTFFSIRFNTLNKGKMSENIGITSRVTKAEAYGIDDSWRGLALNFMTKQEEGSNEFFLEQNRPNPFGDQTIIGFQIPESSTVILTIYDTHGKIVHQYQQNYAAGYNQILVDAKEIGVTGLLYYKIETDQYAATKKMVIID